MLCEFQSLYQFQYLIWCANNDYWPIYLVLIWHLVKHQIRHINRIWSDIIRHHFDLNTAWQCKLCERFQIFANKMDTPRAREKEREILKEYSSGLKWVKWKPKGSDLKHMAMDDKLFVILINGRSINTINKLTCSTWHTSIPNCQFEPSVITTPNSLNWRLGAGA